MSDFDACLALALAYRLKKKHTCKKKKRVWMKDWLKRRNIYTHENLLNDLRSTEPSDYKNFLRMDASTFDELLLMVSPHIQKQGTIMRDAIPPSQRLSITLRYLATGNSFEDLKFTSAISAQSIGRIVMETCIALIVCLKDCIKLPTTEDEWKDVATGFNNRWNFPNCLGAIDGKHIAIKKPPHSGSNYYNYKKFFSVVLLAVVNSNYEFMMVDVGKQGRMSDGGVLGYTNFGKAMSNKSLKIPQPTTLPNSNNELPFVFVADDAFALTENIMKPYARTHLTYKQRIFNYRLSRSRRIVENAFGILVSKFGVFQRPIALLPKKVRIVSLACCFLHNYLRKKQGRGYIANDSLDNEVLQTGTVTEGTWRKTCQTISLQSYRRGNPKVTAKGIRNTFCDYFNNEGRVEWQDKFIHQN